MGLAVIIFNPIAGSARGASIAEEAAKHLRNSGWQVELIATRDRSGAVAPAREAAEGTELLVVVGGDGTLREAIQGLGERRGEVLLGFVPIGNANVAAQELSIPLQPEKAIRVLTEGAPQAIDLGVLRIGEHLELFLAMVGIGWDAFTVYWVDRLRHSRVGRVWYRIHADSVYVVAGMLASILARPVGCSLKVDGAMREPSYPGIHLCNFAAYGKGMAMAPDADPRSGRIHYQARKRGDVISLARHLLHAALGRRAPRQISDYGSGREFVITADRPFRVQVDGDDRGELTRIEVGVVPDCVKIVAPSVAAAVETHAQRAAKQRAATAIRAPVGATRGVENAGPHTPPPLPLRKSTSKLPQFRRYGDHERAPECTWKGTLARAR